MKWPDAVTRQTNSIPIGSDTQGKLLNLPELKLDPATDTYRTIKKEKKHVFQS